MAALPGPGFEDAIRPHTGDIRGIRPTSRGNSSAVTVLISGTRGEFFVKAVPNRPGGRRDSLVREGLINPFVSAFSPAVLWRAETDQWLALGFEVIHASPADFTPGSPDLPRIVDTLTRIAELPLPDIAHSWHETRWDPVHRRPDAHRVVPRRHPPVHRHQPRQPAGRRRAHVGDRLVMAHAWRRVHRPGLPRRAAGRRRPHPRGGGGVGGALPGMVRRRPSGHRRVRGCCTEHAHQPGQALAGRVAQGHGHGC